MELLTTFPNHWFSVNKNHSLTGHNGEPVPHLLFDTTPEFDTKNKTVNVVITVPEGAEHSYNIDLNSGQKYYTHTYCKQEDVWNKYDGSIYRPDFSIAYIPRVLDQLGEPQKVIVWSKRKKIRETASSNYHRVKFVGGYVESICPEGNCLGKSNWLSKLVLVGVDNEDQDLNHVNTIAEFKKAINWERSRAELQNIDGRNFIGEQTYPAVRVGDLIEYNDAFAYFKKRSIFLSDDELKKVQKGCHALYTGLWEEVGKERPEDRPAKTTEELKEKIKLIKELRKEKRPVGFAARFRSFTKKYFNEVSTCEKFVYHGNINRDREAFWFLSYLGIYYRLHRDGYFFDCGQKTWKKNVINHEGNFTYDIKRDIDQCSEKDIDLAMEYLPNFLAGLKGEKEYYKFIDYDNYPFGTHNKMYAWVKFKSRKFDCRKDLNVEINKELKVFPEDVRWKERHIKDITDDKIIY